MKYGSRIAELRIRLGLTQEDLSLRVGVSRSALSHYEQSRREPDYETLVKLADTLGTTVDYLVGRDSVQYSLESQEPVGLQFHLDGVIVTPAELKRFLAFVRSEREINRLASRGAIN